MGWATSGKAEPYREVRRQAAGAVSTVQPASHTRLRDNGTTNGVTDPKTSAIDALIDATDHFGSISS